VLPQPEQKASDEGTVRDPAGEREAALLRAVAAGDRAAFETLYRCYFPRLGRFLQRVLRHPHLVEEALNDAMYVVWNKAASFNGRSKVSTWIFAIAYRRALKCLAGYDAALEFDADQAESPEPGPDRILMNRERDALLAHALAQMTPEHRAVIELTYFHGCRYQEIAQIVGCPVDTVKTRMFHARKRLRCLLPGHEEDFA